MFLMTFVVFRFGNDRHLLPPNRWKGIARRYRTYASLPLSAVGYFFSPRQCPICHRFNEALLMLPSRSLVRSNDHLVRIGRHPLKSRLENVDIAVTLVKHLLWFYDDVLTCGRNVTASVFCFLLFVTHEINLKELMFFIRKWWQEFHTMIILALSLKGEHETWLTYFICRAKRRHRKAGLVFSDIFRKRFDLGIVPDINDSSGFQRVWSDGNLASPLEQHMSEASQLTWKKALSIRPISN